MEPYLKLCKDKVLSSNLETRHRQKIIFTKEQAYTWLKPQSTQNFYYFFGSTFHLEHSTQVNNMVQRPVKIISVAIGWLDKLFDPFCNSNTLKAIMSRSESLLTELTFLGATVRLYSEENPALTS